MTGRNTFMTEVVAGAAAGLAASFVSETFQALWNAIQERETGQPAEGGDDQDDSAPVKAGDKASELVTGRPVPPPHREAAGGLVHYLTGAGLGGLYGLLAARAPGVTAGRGLAFGAITNLLLNEALVPALGLAPSPLRTPPAKHAYALATHLVFGLALEAARRVIRRRP